jgi:hypothetical protein
MKIPLVGNDFHLCIKIVCAILSSIIKLDHHQICFGRGSQAKEAGVTNVSQGFMLLRSQMMLPYIPAIEKASVSQR